MLSNFVAFILTHGRPKNVKTYDTLKKCGYTGRVFIVIDNEDKTANEYREKYGDLVIEFDKSAVAKVTDSGDNFKERNTVLYARNAVYGIAEEMGIKSFIVLDDDYSDFVYKYDAEKKFKESRIKNLDAVFESFLKYYLSTNAESIALAQNGDFIGGAKSTIARNPKMIRKAMQTFFCHADRKINFVSRMNDDVTTYLSRGATGGLFLTVLQVAIIQGVTQKNKGGLTEMYNALGTYVKSFYSVMYCPSCVKVTLMGDKHKRLHHRVSWNNAVPVILHESFKKK